MMIKKGTVPIVALVLLGLFGCAARPVPIVVDDFSALYESVTFAQGVVGAPPPPSERTGEAPTVVNWFYAGTRGQGTGSVHRIILRSATWDPQTGEPRGEQTRYDVSAEQLSIMSAMPITREVRQWVPLHEAATGIEPPPGLDSWREPAAPIEVSPTDRIDDGEVSDAIPLPELPELPDQ